MLLNKDDHITIYSKESDYDSDYSFTFRGDSVKFVDFLIFGEKFVIATRNEGLISVSLYDHGSFDRYKLNLNEGDQITGLTDTGATDRPVFIVSIKDSQGKLRHEIVDEKIVGIDKAAGKVISRYALISFKPLLSALQILSLFVFKHLSNFGGQCVSGEGLLYEVNAFI